MRGLGRPKESLHLKNQWLKFERLGRAFRPAQGRSLSEQAQSEKSEGGSGGRSPPIPLCASPRAVTGELKGNVDLTVPL